MAVTRCLHGGYTAVTRRVHGYMTSGRAAASDMVDRHCFFPPYFSALLYGRPRLT